MSEYLILSEYHHFLPVSFSRTWFLLSKNKNMYPYSTSDALKNKKL